MINYQQNQKEVFFMLNFLAEYINEHCDFNDERQSGKVKYQISTIFILVFIGLLCSYTNILSISYFIKRNKKTFQKYELLDEENCPSKIMKHQEKQLIINF